MTPQIKLKSSVPFIFCSNDSKKTVKQQNTKTLSDPQNEAAETHRNLRVMTVEFNDSNQLCSFRLEIPVGEMRSQVVKDVMR